ncbi:MAG TPA: hypothetical protein VMB78_00835 [Dissulfurispiraceae bacterium]|nr:hypothetical protein [Dissulfurispiraceae bacterium]
MQLKPSQLINDALDNEKNMGTDADCTIVDRSIRLEDLKHWKRNDTEPIPFYLQMGDSGGLVFNDNPEIVRRLIRTYNSQKMFYCVNLVTFLNAEGIAASRVSAPVDDVLGYHAEFSCN